MKKLNYLQNLLLLWRYRRVLTYIAEAYGRKDFSQTEIVVPENEELKDGYFFMTQVALLLTAQNKTNRAEIEILMREVLPTLIKK